MKEFVVSLWNEPRTLRYTAKSRLRLERRFGKSLHPWLWEDVGGRETTYLDPNGDSKNDRHRFTPGKLEAQMWLIVEGLRDILPKDDAKAFEQVEKWLEEEITDGRPIDHLWTTAFNAIFYSGVVTGRCVDFEALGPEDSGKAETKAEEST